MRMTSLGNGGDFFLKNLGFVPGLPLCWTGKIWYDDYLRINANQTRLNTNWYDAVRCNKMQHDGDTMQYEAVRWWWRINTIALWCDENTIGTNRNLHKPMRTCAIQYNNAIIVHRIATYYIHIGLQTNTKVAANQYEVIRINTVLCDSQRMPIHIGSQTKFATVGWGHYTAKLGELWVTILTC